MKALTATGHEPTGVICDLLDMSPDYSRSRADAMIHCAGMVGGIKLNQDRPADLMSANIRMADNALGLAYRSGVKRFINLGSVCAYPDIPTMGGLTTTQLWDGRPEESNAPYGIAKRVGMELVDAYTKQYGITGVNLILANVYGPGAKTGQLAHVIPALVDRFLDAADRNLSSVTVWGSGGAQREFLFVEDAAKAIVDFGLTAEAGTFNVGSGRVVTIRQLVDMVVDLTGFKGTVLWDTSMPDSNTMRLMTNNVPFVSTDFPTGLRRTVEAMTIERSKRASAVS